MLLLEWFKTLTLNDFKLLKMAASFVIKVSQKETQNKMWLKKMTGEIFSSQYDIDDIGFCRRKAQPSRFSSTTVKKEAEKGSCKPSWDTGTTENKCHIDPWSNLTLDQLKPGFTSIHIVFLVFTGSMSCGFNRGRGRGVSIPPQVQSSKHA